ncbi:MAG TPA: hypothetical protein P5531_14320 [Bacteroidales bacterium]|nr:hypothetical protein [Bacteroidales bacterium]HSA42586.1 hypothetical protein [Bacteroidales bacterium]
MSSLKIGLLLLLLPIACNNHAQAPCNRQAERVREAREHWIGLRQQQMLLFTTESCKEIIQCQTIDLIDLQQTTYRLHGQGCIFFVDGSWVTLVSVSSHEDTAVGDITLARDDRGMFYQNDGHVCGGMIHFVIKNRTDIRTAADFFRDSRSDTDDKPWKAIAVRK